MIDPLRQEIAALATTVVAKIGTRSLSNADGTLNIARVESLAGELHALMQAGKRVLLVSSGAVGAGMGQLGMKKRPEDLAQLQAVAAIGQCYLVQAYDRALKALGRHAAQVLLTADDLDHRARYLNVRNTLVSLLELGAVPIINENDTVSVEELQTTFGDNDRLAALVTNLVQAPLLVILSDVDGLYDRDPRDPAARLIHTVEEVTEEVFALCVDRLTGHSKGGMASKLHAARICTTAGENVVIANGAEAGQLTRVLNGELVGTLFLAQGAHVASRKRWIGFSRRPKGKLTLDEGAQKAVVKLGRSLLAAGVVDSAGDFAKGDLVALVDAQGEEFARGLTNYAADDLRRIRGRKSGEIAEILGHRPYEEVIHRDNLAVTRSPRKE